MFDVTIQPMPVFRLAALRHQGPDDGIGQAFDRLAAWGHARGLIGPATRFFGLYHDDPASVPAAGLRADASFTLPAGVVADGGVRILDMPAFEAATLVFQGPYAGLDRAYDWVLGTWLPGSGRALSVTPQTPIMDEGLNNPRTTPPAGLLTRIIIPLEPRE
jgi:AraC family transcriptional regulator